MAGKRRRKTKKAGKFPAFLMLLLLAGVVWLFSSHGGDVQAFSRKAKPAAGMELPSRLYDREEQIIRHTGYTVSYNEHWRLPNWVAYELTEEETRGTVGRTNRFLADPQIIGAAAETSDYTHSGYDRGHMAPAADMKWSAQAMKESFYMSNICPQLHNLNAGDWKDLEEQVRTWAQRYGSVYVACGPMVGKSPKRIGVNKVAVPERFYKVVLRYGGKRQQAIGFVMEQKKGNRPLAAYAVSVDRVEAMTGIDFFPSLPDEVEAKIETECSPEAWGLH